MKNFILKKYTNRFWSVAELEIYKNEKLVETILINKFYGVTKDWFFEYDASGGSGIGYKPGEIIRKIYIGDSEFKQIVV